MIDIHNHIIPNVDDGPHDDEAMMALLKQAANQGITGILATPHHLHPSFNNDYETIATKVEAINQREDVKALGLRIYPGQEIRITDQILDGLQSQQIKGVNNSRFLLIELPSKEVPHFTKRIIFELLTRDYVPVIVHPERNKAIAQDINVLYELINAGALSQMTTSSLTGHMGKNIQKQSIQMIEHHLTHFIGSDAHSVNQRPFAFEDLFSSGKHSHLEGEIKILLDNNEAMINNGKIMTSQPIEFKKKKFFGLF